MKNILPAVAGLSWCACAAWALGGAAAVAPARLLPAVPFAPRAAPPRVEVVLDAAPVAATETATNEETVEAEDEGGCG